MRTWPALKIHQADDDDLIQAFLIDFNLAAIGNSQYFFHSSDDRDRAALAPTLLLYSRWSFRP